MTHFAENLSIEEWQRNPALAVTRDLYHSHENDLDFHWDLWDYKKTEDTLGKLIADLESYFSRKVF